MRAQDFVGKTIQELADTTGIFWNIAHIFVAAEGNELTGTRLMDTYSLKQVISVSPAAADAVVVSAKEICGEMFIFVKANGGLTA